MDIRPIVIDVIILSNAKNAGLRVITERAINSLIDSENSNQIRFNIVVLESNQKLKNHQYKNAFTYYPREPFGYNRFVNIGLKMTNNPFVCICNNDLIFHAGWATEILSAFTSISDLSSACPLCPAHHRKVSINSNSGYHFGYEIRRQLVGWCIVLRREILQTIGLFDPKFRFWYADNDYANMLNKHGLKHALVSSAIVDHLESQTLKQADYSTQVSYTIGEKYYFDYKWNGLGFLDYKFRKIRLKALLTYVAVLKAIASLTQK